MYLLEYFFLLTAALYYTAGCPAPDRTPEYSLNGEVKDDYPEGASVTYSCHPGFSRVGQIKRVCSGGKWMFLSPIGSCRKRSCGHPGDIPFGSFELKGEESFVFGAVVEYSCDEGYQMVSKQRKRECTATGWSNFPPHCEVKRCPPLEVTDNVKLVSTSYDEEYSVGQVIQFECKDSKLKLDGPPEIFCTSEGEWNIKPPICIEITCSLPEITNGKDINPEKPVYRENNILSFACHPGFKASRNGETTCTKMGWSPPPHCEAITCNQYQQVENGKLLSKKSVYRATDTIELQCDPGYRTQEEPTQLRVCTSNGWSPSAVCFDRRCDRPQINNGNLYENYYFPARRNKVIYYSCNTGFVPQKKSGSWGVSDCSETGWNPQPKCLKTCNRRDAVLQNANIHFIRDVFVEGEKIDFFCYNNLLTPDGRKSGEITCLSDGKWSSGKCFSTCTIPNLQNGKYLEDKVDLEIGDSLQYECNDGFKSTDGNIVGSLQCLTTGLSIKPECKAIDCVWLGKIYSSGKRIQYPCPSGQSHSGSNLSQCFYYGFGPTPACGEFSEAEENVTGLVNGALALPCTYLVSGSVKSMSWERGGCSLLNSNPEIIQTNGREVTGSKSKRYQILGNILQGDVSLTINEVTLVDEGNYCCRVKTSGWRSDKRKEIHVRLQESGTETTASPETTAPAKEPAKKPETRLECAPANSPPNAKILEPRQKYYSDDIVTIECEDGYKMHGSATIQCKKGVWESPPQCSLLRKCNDPPPIQNGKPEGPKRDYDSASIVKYSCNIGYHISGSDQSICDDGQWTTSPVCTENACTKAPSIANGHIKLKIQKNEYKHGENVLFDCIDGYILSNIIPAQCITGHWENVPSCDDTSCENPPNVKNAELITRKTKYKSGETASYTCKSGTVVQSIEAVCENGKWKSIPVCTQLGNRCGPAPDIDFGDTKDNRKDVYDSDSEVEYQCRAYYLLQGNKKVRCIKGVWETAPQCLKPCTIKDKDMIDNNIKLRWEETRKLYSEHGDVAEFTCISGFDPLPGIVMRQKCLSGVINYPKCLKRGFCTLQEKTMNDNKIYYSTGTIVNDGETIVFECNVGMVPEKDLRARCANKDINYPRCIPGKICNSISIENGKIEPKKSRYESGTSVQIKCKENHVLSENVNPICDNGQWSKQPTCIPLKSCNAPNILNGNPKSEQSSYDSGSSLDIECKKDHILSEDIIVICDNGQWTKLPMCVPTLQCRISTEEMDNNNVILTLPDDLTKTFDHGAEISITCKSGTKRQNQLSLMALCNNGTMVYKRCFSGKTCRLNQDNIDENNLVLHEVHNDEGFYGEGENIMFKCKEGFHSSNGLIGNCTKETISYPICTAGTSV